MIASLARLARMDVSEAAWRLKAAARIGVDRFRASRAAPSWDRRALASALAPDPALDAARAAIGEGRWQDAHRALAFHIAFSPQRFALAPANHSTLGPAIRERFPRALSDATVRAEAILEGRYDLLGYRNLSFQRGPSPVDWRL